MASRATQASMTRKTHPEQPAVVELALAADNPRATAKAEAEARRLNFSVVWQWVMEEARQRARDCITEDAVRAAFSNPTGSTELCARAAADHTGAMANRLNHVLRTVDITAGEIEAFFTSLPADRSLDYTAEALIFRTECSASLLMRLMYQRRCITAIAHRPGPRHVLEAVVDVYPMDEPVLTLIRDHYSRPEAKLVELCAFVEKVGAKHGATILDSMEHWELPDERRAAIVALLEQGRA